LRRRILYGSLIGAGAAAVALVLWTAGTLDRLENTTWAWRVHASARPSPSTENIKLILLDQASLDWGSEQNGWSWPWPREVYAPILDFCRRGNARVVAFDVLFTEPSVYGVADDEALEAAIRRTPAFVGALVLKKNAGGADLPIPEIARSATVMANVADDPDEDGVFRRAVLLGALDGREIPSLGLAAYLRGRDPTPSGDALRLDEHDVYVGGQRIPVDGDGRAILRFAGPFGVHPAVSAAAVIQSELRILAGEKPVLDPEFFRDSFVIFGFSAPGLLDLRPTPLSRVSPGVEIHATVLDNLLTNGFIRRPATAVVVLATLLVALCASLLVTWSRRAWLAAAVLIVVLPVPAIAGLVGYRMGFWWPVVEGELAVALAFVGSLVLNYATEGRQKRFIKQAFKLYLSPHVIDRILKDPSQLRLGGERRELTILFSDLEGFTSISEKLDPVALTSLLNDYLSDMTEIILDEGGTLDKYEGDAVIAFWNAPVSQPDHALRATRAAWRCQERLAERREEFLTKTGASLRMRIGLNTGEAVAGNMGSHQRFNYTVLGDAANLASRLEGANKAFGTYTMLAESTRAAAGDAIRAREMGSLRVVGRGTPVRVYELLGMAGGPEPPGLATFARGLELVQAGRTGEALAVFEGIPDDALARTYAERCRALLAAPDPSWDGVWVLSGK
jgi:adenylate cyclase